MPAFTLQKAVAAMAVVGLSCGLPAGAADIRDRIVAVVNTEIIALSELEEEVAEITLEAHKRFRGAELDQRLRQIDFMGLNRMIERKLQLQIAKRRGIKISDEEVKDAVARLRRTGEAPNENDPRELGLIRDQLTTMRLVNQQVRSGLLASDEEVLRFYQQHKDRFMLPPEVRISQILIALNPGSELLAVREKAQQVFALLKKGERFEELVSAAHAARTRIREAAYQQLHRDTYRSEMAAGILARVPGELDALNEEVVVTACIGLGFTIERPRGRRIFAIELGSGALVDSLPGVPGGSSYVGSFDREEALEEETLDFFASGHPLVEGIFAHYEDSALGRVARFEIEIGQERGEGLVAVYKDGPVFEVVAVDSAGRTRPDWAAVIRRRPLGARPVTNEPVETSDWTGMVRRLGAQLDPARRPHALAAIVVRPLLSVLAAR